jgi:hypothetical protein
LPRFDISFGRGQFSKTNQQITGSNSPSVISASNGLNRSKSIHHSPSRVSILNKMKKSKSTSSISNTNGFHNNHHQQQRKSLNTSASAKLSSKIKKKYSKHSKVIEENKRIVSNENRLKATRRDKDQELCTQAELELKRLESVKLMDMKSKNSVFILCFKNIYFFKLFQ